MHGETQYGGGNMGLKLEQKLKSSLISDKLEQEVLDKPDWYRNQPMATTRELNALRNSHWNPPAYASITTH